MKVRSDPMRGLVVLFNLLPGLVNIITGLLMFISAKRMAESGANSFMIAATMTMWALFYALTAFGLGFVLTKRNAVRVLLAGQMVLLVSLLGLMLVPGVTAQYFWLAGTGIGTATFFTAFQAVVKLFGKEEYAMNIARNSLKFRQRYHELFKTIDDTLPPEEYRWLKRSELGLAPELELDING